MTVTETRKLNHERLRSLCIEKNWFTCGDNIQYRELLNKAENAANVTAELIAELAADIKRHSDTDYNVENIAFCIAGICHSYFDISEGDTDTRQTETAHTGANVSPYERTRAVVYATGNKWAIENFNATH